MATTRRRRTSGITPFGRLDQYGKRSIPGSAALVTERQVRRATKGRTQFVHRAPNGCYDPYTFFHLVEALLSFAPYTPFTAGQFADWLNAERPAFVWDAITVGRILNDIKDNLAEANPDPTVLPISSMRDWSGVYYEMTDHPVGRAILFRLLNDLFEVCEGWRVTEDIGMHPKRLQSPLLACPSVMDVAAAIAEGMNDAA